MSIVTIQPKSIVGSSGSVHASNLVNIRAHFPELFENSSDCNQQHPKQLKQAAIYIQDSIHYYQNTTKEPDFAMVTDLEKCKFRDYELERVQHLRARLLHAEVTYLEGNNELDSFQPFVIPLIAATDKLVDALEECYPGRDIWNLCLDVLTNIQNTSDFIDVLALPVLRSNVLENTDAGGGVGVSNYHVRFRMVELAKLHRSTSRHRVHLASDDQGQNPAERTNAYIGWFVIFHLVSFTSIII